MPSAKSASLISLARACVAGSRLPLHDQRGATALLLQQCARVSESRGPPARAADRATVLARHARLGLLRAGGWPHSTRQLPHAAPAPLPRPRPESRGPRRSGRHGRGGDVSAGRGWGQRRVGRGSRWSRRPWTRPERDRPAPLSSLEAEQASDAGPPITPAQRCTDSCSPRPRPRRSTPPPPRSLHATPGAVRVAPRRHGCTGRGRASASARRR